MIIKPDQQGAYDSFLDLEDSDSETASTSDRLAESGDLPAYTPKALPSQHPLEAPPSYEAGDISRGGERIPARDPHLNDPNFTGPSAASHQEDQAQRNLRALRAPANTEASPSRLSASSERTAETRPSQVRSTLGSGPEAPTQSNLLRRLQSTLKPLTRKTTEKVRGPIGKPQPLDTLDTRLDADAFSNPRTPPRPPGFIDPFILPPLSDGSSANEPPPIDRKRRELGRNAPQQAPISSQGSENTREALKLQVPAGSHTEAPPPYYVTNPDSRPASPTSPNPAADHGSLDNDDFRNSRPSSKSPDLPPKE